MVQQQQSAVVEPHAVQRRKWSILSPLGPQCRYGPRLRGMICGQSSNQISEEGRCPMSTHSRLFPPVHGRVRTNTKEGEAVNMNGRSHEHHASRRSTARLQSMSGDPRCTHHAITVLPRSGKQIQASMKDRKSFASYHQRVWVARQAPRFSMRGAHWPEPASMCTPHTDALNQHCTSGRSNSKAAAANKHCGVHGLAAEGDRLQSRRYGSGQPVSGVAVLTACSRDERSLAAAVCSFTS